MGVVIRMWTLDPTFGYRAPWPDDRKADAMAKQAVELAMGKEPPQGPYLKSYDPDGKGGAGTWEFTPLKTQAKVFANQGEAFECWRAVSKVQPRRVDGRPNRPLTQFNITFEDAP